MNTGISRNGAVFVSLILLAFIVICFAFYEIRPRSDDKIGSSVRDVLNSTDEGIKEFREEVKDEIDDNTDSR